MILKGIYLITRSSFKNQQYGSRCNPVTYYSFENRKRVTSLHVYFHTLHSFTIQLWLCLWKQHCYLYFPPVLVLCSFVQLWHRQNWSDSPKLHGDETISQCSDFNSTPWGNIVSSHYSSSMGRHTHSMQPLSSVARVFSCAPETKANVMYKLLHSSHVL